MNPERIKTLAANAIGVFAKTHNTSCVLSLRDGLVVATASADMKHKYDKCLLITRYAQNAGLTSAHWQLVGIALFKLYRKDLICQAHQKHLIPPSSTSS